MAGRQRVALYQRHAVADHRAAYFAAKRVLDVILALVLLVLLAPVSAVAALLVRLESAGPVLSAHQRLGYDADSPASRTFAMYRLRTHYLPVDQGAGTGLARATRTGPLLARAHLDELPQLLNVLRGEMSMVGPRPATPAEVASYRAWHLRRLEVTPGMTGWWLVAGHGGGMDEMARLDIEYIERQSLWLDFKILLLTVPRLLLGAATR